MKRVRRIFQSIDELLGRKYLVETMGMDERDWPRVSVKCLKYIKGCGLGSHADSPGSDGNKLFKMRICGSVGGSCDIECQAYRFTANDQKVERSEPGAKFSFSTFEGGDFGSDVTPGCPLDATGDPCPTLMVGAS